MESYDYIVIGAGSAGCVVARRLTEDKAVRVLLIEAGGSDKSFLFRRPGALAIVYQYPRFKKKADWGYRTTPQPHMDDRDMMCTRGKILGGCSTVNGMIYIRGHRDNYDQWRDWGNPGWGYDDVLPYFKKSESHEDGASEMHGGDGPLRVTHQRGCSPLSDAFIEVISKVCEVPVIDDFNVPDHEGASMYDMTCADRRRMSTAVTYLAPVLDRDNLDVLTETHVARVLIEDGRAVGVEVIEAGGRRTIGASKEVILSAGVIGSAQILMLSGIGPSAHLQEHGIEVIHDSPGVGQNLHDHLLAPIRFLTTKDTGHKSTALHFLSGMLNDFLFNKGWFGKTFLEAGGFVRSAPDKPLPDLQYFCIPWSYPEPNDDDPKIERIATEYSFTVLAGLIYPESRGSVTLRSADPLDRPLIDPAYLADERDMDALLAGCRLARRFAETEPLAQYIVDEAFPGKQAQTDDEMRAHIRLSGRTIYHPVGTCKMGNDELAVVDHELRVRGIDGLRVADASIMPRIVGGNTNAPAIMIGEKVSDMLKASRSG